MPNKNRVIVKILGQEYTMVSDEPREYMQKVANYVDDKMIEIAEKNKKFSTAMIAVLSALNIGDEFFKISDDYDKIKSEQGKPAEELEKTKEILSEANVKMNDMEKKYESLLEEYDEMKETLKEIEGSYLNLREEINRLSYECNIKDNKLQKAEKINEDLKNKLMQSEIKLVQTKKELKEFIEAFDS